MHSDRSALMTHTALNGRPCARRHIVALPQMACCTYTYIAGRHLRKYGGGSTSIGLL